MNAHDPRPSRRAAHLVRAAALDGYCTLVRELGGDPKALLARAHLPDIEEEDVGFVPHVAAVTLYELTAASLRCSDFGLRLGSAQNIDVLGPVAVLARHSATVGEALSSLTSFLHLHSPAERFEVRVDGAVVEVRVVSDSHASVSQIQNAELNAALSRGIATFLLGRPFPFDEVSFTHRRQSPVSVYRAVFDCPVRFEQAFDGVRFHVSLFGEPIPHADPRVRRVALEYLRSSLGPSASISDRVAELISRLLDSGHFGLADVAEHLAMHPRTLQRRLAEVSSPFEAILDETRRGLARRLLEETDVPLVRVSQMLGYAEQSALSRSCRRWFGVSPRSVRRRRSP